MAKRMPLIISVIGLTLLVYGIFSEVLTYVDLLNAVSPAYQSDYENATKNLGDFLSDYITGYAFHILIVSIISAIPFLAFLKKYL